MAARRAARGEGRDRCASRLHPGDDGNVQRRRAVGDHAPFAAPIPKFTSRFEEANTTRLVAPAYGRGALDVVFRLRTR